MDEQFFGAQPGIPPYEEQPGDVDLAKTEKIGQTFGWALTTEDLTKYLAEVAVDKKSYESVAKEFLDAKGIN